MLAFVRARAIEGIEEVDADVDGGAYRRTFETGVVEVRRENDSHLLATIQLDDVRVVTSIVVRLKRLLDLDADRRATNQASFLRHYRHLVLKQAH